jgi:hypothetical protein
MNDLQPTTADLLSRLPSRSLGDLETLVKASAVLAAEAHEKMTVRQTLFFFAVAYHSLAGQSINIARLREIYSPLGRSIEKSISQFLEPSRVSPDALGWIAQTVDPDDRRVRYLTLTPEGADVVGAVVEAMRTH